MKSPAPVPETSFAFLVDELRESRSFTNDQLYERVAERMQHAGLPSTEALRLEVYANLEYLIRQQGAIKESRIERGAVGRKFYYSGTDKLRTSVIPPP